VGDVSLLIRLWRRWGSIGEHSHIMCNGRPAVCFSLTKKFEKDDEMPILKQYHIVSGLRSRGALSILFLFSFGFLEIF